MESGFVLPEFYMPFQVRVNPHVAATRDHAREWVRQMGMVAPGNTTNSGAGWSLEQYDTTDFPQFAALTYPDADAAELALLAGWLILLWYVDDTFKAAYRQNPAPDRVGREIERFMMFFPAYPAPAPLPGSPAERAVADLWARTAGPMSPAWRRRCAAAFRRFLEGSHIEVRSTPDRLADPISFIPLRRDIGAMAFVMCLLEHALGTEMPPQVCGLRSFRALNNAADDCTGLQNDIYSYAREAANGEADTNGVRVFQQALGGTLQQAADIVNRFLTARMRTFEAVADFDLPEELSTLTAEVREKTLGYADALRSMLAGVYAWPFHTTRYGFSSPKVPVAQRPSGLGTSAAALATQLHR